MVPQLSETASPIRKDNRAWRFAKGGSVGARLRLGADTVAVASLCLLVASLLFLGVQIKAIYSDQLKREYIGLVLDAIDRANVARSVVGESKHLLDSGELSPQAYRRICTNLATRLATLAALIAASPFDAPRIRLPARAPDVDLDNTRALLSSASAYWREQRNRTDADVRTRATRLANSLVVLSIVLSGALVTASVMYAKHARQLTNESHRFKCEALHDEMTGLPNRRQLLGAIEVAATALCRGQSPHKIAVLYMDLDGFKEVNDSLGHPAGDEFLISASRRFRQAVHATDLVARIGGDEFAILVREFSTDAQLAAIARRLITCVGETAERIGIGGGISASIGIASFPDTVSDYRRLIAAADETMYYVKRTGKSRYAFAASTDSYGR
jgi:diguanylate cyclase (GGDEF)-like protein